MRRPRPDRPPRVFLAARTRARHGDGRAPCLRDRKQPHSMTTLLSHVRLQPRPAGLILMLPERGSRRRGPPFLGQKTPRQGRSFSTVVSPCLRRTVRRPSLRSLLLATVGSGGCHGRRTSVWLTSFSIDILRASDAPRGRHSRTSWSTRKATSAPATTHSAYMRSSGEASATREGAAHSSSCPPPSTRTVTRRAVPERQHVARRRPMA